MQEQRLYDLKALCAEAGVTPRTVHFYIQTGLLRPAGTPGPGARYDEGHLSRLRLIRLLQREHLPLAEIRRRLETLSDADAQDLLREHKSQPQSVQSSALDYVRSVLSGARGERTRTWAAQVSRTTRPKTVPTVWERSHWERIAFSADVELHVRRPLSREQNQQLEQLVAFARKLFEEEKS
jgi:DNA-binding transcriptional MerR regulator